MAGIHDPGYTSPGYTAPSPSYPVYRSSYVRARQEGPRALRAEVGTQGGPQDPGTPPRLEDWRP